MLTDRKEGREWGGRGRNKGIGERVARRPSCALDQRSISLEQSGRDGEERCRKRREWYKE